MYRTDPDAAAECSKQFRRVCIDHAGADGVGLSYAVANAIFGGSVEYVALLLKKEGIETSFFWYVSAMGALAFLVSLMLHRKGKGISL